MINRDCCIACINDKPCSLDESEYTIEELKGLCKKLDKANGWIVNKEELHKRYENINEELQNKLRKSISLKKEINILGKQLTDILEKILGAENYY